MAAAASTRAPHIVSIVMNGVSGDGRVIKNAQVAIDCGFKATILGMAENDIFAEREIEGVRAILVPNPVGDLGRAWKDRQRRPLWLLVEHVLERMLPLIEELEPDLLHSHDMLSLRIGSEAGRHLAAKGRVVPWIHDIHEFVRGLTNLPDSYRLPCEEYERLYLRQADDLLTVSERLSAEVAAFYKLPNAPTVVFNAAHKISAQEDGRDIRLAIGLGQDVPLVVYSGSLKAERGCETLIRALPALPSAHVCFVTNSPYLAQLKALAAGLGVDDRVHAHPYVPTDEVTSFIRTADVGIHPLTHYPNAEVAMPNKLFEYLQAGIPLAVSDVAEMKRFVESTGVGEVFVAENPESCAAAIGSILAEPGRYRARITDELQREFSWQKQREKVAATYRALLSRDGANSPTLNVVDSTVATASRTLQEIRQRFPGEHVAWLGPDEPPEPVEIFIDRSDMDSPGLLSRTAKRYRNIRLHEPVAWPSALDRLALDANGNAIWSMRDPEATENDALMQAVESSRLAAAERVRRATADAGLRLATAEAVLHTAVSAALGKAEKRWGEHIAKIEQRHKKQWRAIAAGLAQAELNARQAETGLREQLEAFGKSYSARLKVNDRRLAASEKSEKKVRARLAAVEAEVQRTGLRAFLLTWRAAVRRGLAGSRDSMRLAVHRLIQFVRAGSR